MLIETTILNSLKLLKVFTTNMGPRESGRATESLPSAGATR